MKSDCLFELPNQLPDKTFPLGKTGIKFSGFLLLVTSDRDNQMTAKIKGLTS